jgi:hypothetical protein
MFASALPRNLTRNDNSDRWIWDIADAFQRDTGTKEAVLSGLERTYVICRFNMPESSFARVSDGLILCIFATSHVSRSL